jgi:two-component system NarL family response regulator
MQITNALRTSGEDCEVGWITQNGMDGLMSIMVVDDNSRARRGLMSCLSLKAGIKVTAEAANGLEALALVRRDPPDVILMDLQMPAMDGLTATRVIKKNWPQIKIIALTMYPHYESEAWSAGADAFLVKGCSVHEMISAIYALFQGDELDNFHPKEQGELSSMKSPQIA